MAAAPHVVAQSLLASLEHIIYVHFVYLYLLDFSLLTLALRVMAFVFQTPLMLSKSVRLSVNYVVIINAIFVLNHFSTPQGPAVIIDYFGSPPTTSRLFLIWLDLLVTVMQLFRTLILHTTKTSSRTSRLFFAITPAPASNHTRHSSHRSRSQSESLLLGSSSGSPSASGQSAQQLLHMSSSSSLESSSSSSSLPYSPPLSPSLAPVGSSSSSAAGPAAMDGDGVHLASASESGTGASQSRSLARQPSLNSRRATSAAALPHGSLSPLSSPASTAAAGVRDELSTVFTMEFDIPGVARSIMHERRERRRRSRQEAAAAAAARSASASGSPLPRTFWNRMAALRGSPSSGVSIPGTPRVPRLAAMPTLDINGLRAALNWRIMRLNAQLRAQRRQPASSPSAQSAAALRSTSNSQAMHSAADDADDADESHGFDDLSRPPLPDTEQPHLDLPGSNRSLLAFSRYSQPSSIPALAGMAGIPDPAQHELLLSSTLSDDYEDEDDDDEYEDVDVDVDVDAQQSTVRSRPSNSRNLPV
ncbi:hypothetical protein BC831DRAFT_466395 [Entophlyctis helioformis]|nr:hypothetical protein BC831DRAFT_466395 [Entophlyctis helioformis]